MYAVPNREKDHLTVTYRTKILGVLQLCLDSRVVDSCIQNLAEIAHHVFLGVQQDGFQLRIVRR
jgi:hypothetical protein